MLWVFSTSTFSSAILLQSDAGTDLSFLSTAMRSLHWNLGVLLLFLNASPLLHYISPAQAASTSSPVTRRRIKFMKSDFDYDETISPPPELQKSSHKPLLHGEQQLCQYDSCLENQEPCSDIADRTGCLCPGVSGPNVAPQAPRIRLLQPIGNGKDQGKVEVHWCAPSSVVSRYRVVFQDSDRPSLEFQAFLRSSSIGNVDPGEKVCVEAVNKAGTSAPTTFSCQRYDPPSSSDQRLLAGVIGGGMTLILLVIIVVVSLNKCKSCQKIKTNSADGLRNPSYSKEGTLWFRSKVQTNPAVGSTHRETDSMICTTLMIGGSGITLQNSYFAYFPKKNKKTKQVYLLANLPWLFFLWIIVHINCVVFFLLFFLINTGFSFHL